MDAESSTTGYDNHHKEHSALNNSVVLQVIFSHLDTHHVKLVRTMCKAWEDVGSNILGKRCILQFDRIYNCSPIVRELNSKLLKRVFIPNCEVFGYWEGKPLQECAVEAAQSATVHLNSFASAWNNLIQELDVQVDFAICIRLPALLNAYQFPNLTKITINKLYETDPNSCLPIRSIFTLKELKVTGQADSHSGYTHPLLQCLINSSPNLEVLNINGRFYPSLASLCGKMLKWLGCYVDTSLETQRINELIEIFRMVSEVEDRLEHLTLSTAIWEDGILINDDIDLPKLPKLKSLTLKGFNALDILEEMRPSLLSKLETVALLDLDEYPGSTKTIQSYFAHKGVTSLKVSGLNKYDTITMARQRFPNVNRLVVNIAVPHSEVEEDVKEFFCQILQTCLSWKLFHLEVQFKLFLHVSELIAGLKPFIVGGIKELMIVNLLGRYAYPLFVDDIDFHREGFKEFLQLSAGMGRMTFKNLALKTTNAKFQWLTEFLSQNKNLPIFFLD